MKSLNALDFPDVENNIYYQRNKENFLTLKHIVESNPTSYAKILNAKGFGGNPPKFASIREWITEQTPLLNDTFFSTSTKVYWIFSGLTKFPQCAECGKDLDKYNATAFSGYAQRFCSVSCAIKHAHPADKRKLSEYQLKKKDLDEMLSTMPIIDQLHYIVDNFEDTYPSIISHRKHLADFVKRKTSPMLDNEVYKMSTKLFWIFHDITSWDDARVRCKTCNKPLMFKNSPSIKANTFPEFCNSSCAMNNATIINKIVNTSLKNAGCRWAGVSPDAIRKARTAYKYDNMNFRSSWELALYIFYRDSGMNVIYCPNIHFTYYDSNGNEHTYFPDFQIDDKLIEVKGDHFVKSDGKFQNPFDHELDDIYEAKHQCMLKNGVIMFKGSEIKKCLEYVSATYGEDYLKSFKAQNLEQYNIYAEDHSDQLQLKQTTNKQ